MSDSSKAEKIAAARKKLKQFQSKAKTETASNSTVTSCGIGSSVNTNGTATCIEHTQNDNAMIAIQPQQINMQFEAVDPVQFDSTKLFDQHIPASENMIGSQSEMALNITATPAINTNANLPQQSQTSLAIQTTFPHFSNVSQIASSQPLTTSFSIQQPNLESNPVKNCVSDLSHLAEQCNQELNNLLQVEKVRNHELSVKVTQQHSTIEELSNELNQLRKNSGTIQELQQQVNAHIQTVNILVGEKSDLSAKLNEFESECVELKGRLKASRHRVSELEKDLNTMTQSHQKYDGSQQALCTELETIQEDNKRFKRLHQETCDENTEIQYQLAIKTKEIDELKNVISAKCSELEMVHVRLEQLTGGDLTQSNETSAVEQNHKDQRILDSERQIIELQNMISELTSDRDRTQQQYQSYVQHLTNETTSMNQRIQELTKTNEKLTKREESLVNHVQELEKQIQKQLSTQRRLAALRDNDDKQKADDKMNKDNALNDISHNNDELSTLRKKLNAIEKEKFDLNVLLEEYNTQKLSLQQHLLEKDAKLTEIESELDYLRTERPDTSNLLATIESDKVAASRAMTQNQELRKQLEEMQQAFVQVSNQKLELTSQLQSEEYMNRDIRNRFGDLESELKSIKEKLHFKDEEMIRLTHENSQFGAKIQELSKRLNSSSNDGVRQLTELQKKLHSTKKEIKKLRTKLKEVAPTTEVDELPKNGDENGQVVEITSKCDVENEHKHDHDGEYHHSEHHLDHGHDHNEDDDECKSVEALDNSDVVSVTSTINIATNEAMDKLQERFKRTMNEIADLTEEKQRLEHLVTQLQSETETIGEYIALYQTQRRLLKQREIEKDIQLNRIAADREGMKDKLRQLNELVELLMIQKGFNNAKEIITQLNTTNNNGEKVPENTETPTVINGSSTPTIMDCENIPQNVQPMQNNCHEHDHHLPENDLRSHIIQSHHDTNTRETATKIINLLTDIKDTNLRQDYTVVSNSVDHCSCCSGKLEVV
ncbi:golgin subfamily A member 2 [Contarinia nasturtii]|uniref:golgin subfamily A member 2 n=1 Tax=Contarinia nasturtii TaxID=265458 RepID=UPI0012D43674|nr:golgin subfamily A member 2 [Contarinia nasturtii]